MSQAVSEGMRKEDSHVHRGRRRAVKWALILAAVVLSFYVGFFFLIDARY